MFKKWFSKGEARPAYPLVSAADFSLVWEGKHTLPIPDWEACEPLESISHDEKNQHWNNVAASWLSKLGASFNEPIDLHESANFFLHFRLYLRVKLRYCWTMLSGPSNAIWLRWVILHRMMA